MGMQQKSNLSSSQGFAPRLESSVFHLSWDCKNLWIILQFKLKLIDSYLVDLNSTVTVELEVYFCEINPCIWLSLK